MCALIIWFTEGSFSRTGLSCGDDDDDDDDHLFGGHIHASVQPVAPHQAQALLYLEDTPTLAQVHTEHHHHKLIMERTWVIQGCDGLATWLTAAALDDSFLALFTADFYASFISL